VTTINDYAFTESAILSSVTLGNSVAYIGAGAFKETAIIRVKLPPSLPDSSIGRNAFPSFTIIT
jgi:BspA type Leucine rich repeat region (6 copies)